MPNRSFLQAWVLDPATRFIHHSASSGVILFLSTILALIISNTAMAHAFHELWETKFTIGFEGFQLSKTLHHWINDGLMSMFFFVVGLELKREIVAGELRDIRNVLLPVAAAIGGMIIPAVIYFIFNQDSGSEALNGWGVPMATDIAFALGVLYLLGDRVPLSLKVFLTTLAIIDDLGAVLIIAFFYTSEISLVSLGVGAAIMAVMLVANRLGVRNAVFYGIMGIGGLWLAFLMSGIHATIAAVLAAITIPATVKLDKEQYLAKLHGLIDAFKQEPETGTVIVSENQQELLHKISKCTKAALTPLQKLEHGLHPLVAFVVMPIFAFANAGISFTAGTGEAIASTVALGVMLGLMIGKIAGVFGVSYLLVRLKLIRLPKDSSMAQILGVAFLSAIGFTMSLFIANLAFTDPEMVYQAKIGVLITSLLAGMIGYAILYFSGKEKT